uniref:RNA/RNP complex-1-interacting phosphatase n=1 Tax=Neogobius melanostomus TaxID=47308 RepID=A0A8C6WMD4_9GOBI
FIVLLSRSFYRWLDYQSVGKRLPGTRFIAFKVPLKLALNSHLSSCDVFGHWELLDTLKRENQELGLIIDLTFTTRYYKAEDVPESLHFVKIFTAGHEIPSDAAILSFKRAVRQFLRENIDNDKLIGVHCTHGLNRTGYLICRYLIDVDGVDPIQAIELFNSSRGHAIERQNYLKDLQSGRKRSNEGIEESEQEPVKGSSTHRPVYFEVNARNMDERPSFSHEYLRNKRQKYRLSHTRRGGNSQFVGPSSGGAGLLPTPRGPAVPPFPPGPSLLPLPAFSTARLPFNSSHWIRGSTSQPNYQWHGPSHYSRGGRGNNLSQHAFSSSPGPPQWTNDSGRYTCDAPHMWDGPNMRSQFRRSHRVNPNGYPA